MSMTKQLLSPVAEVRESEAPTALMMFAYSFLAMTAYNIIQPLTRSKLISSLGAVNVPWVIFGSGLFIGVLMLGYTRLVSLLPRRWALPITQGGMAAAMIGFWALFQTGAEWVSVAFYVWGLLLGILLISQFWTLANAIYDPRQAKRLFGFIGGGVMLGGMTGAGLTALIIESVGANTLLLWSALALLACMAIVSIILGRERTAAAAAGGDEGERGVRLARAFGLLKGSKQIQLIAVVIGLGSLGAALIDQQLNMAAEAFKGAGQQDAIGAFLAQVRFFLSAAAFVIQVWITPRIHRYLGIGFALLILPTNLAATAALIILNKVLWAPAVASVMDRSFRYTVDKTTREVLFLPLPSELRQEVKPFVDVTVDRLSRGLGALVILALIQPWGFHLAWYQLSFVSLGLAIFWYFMAFRAKREYLLSFRRSIQERVVRADEVRLSGSELSTVETLVQELAHPDPARVIYAIDVLESLDKRNLVTPLLLYHESPRVRVRALAALAAVREDVARQWTAQIRRLLGDPDAGVRGAAVAALAAVQGEDIATVVRPMLDDPDPRIRVTAAVALAGADGAEDRARAAAVFAEIIADTGETTRAARHDAATALRQIKHPDVRNMLVPLLYDPALTVAEEALASVRDLGPTDFIFLPALITLLRNRQLKARARDVLVSYGEAVVDPLAYVLTDQEEDIWIRRHIPATLAAIPVQKSVRALLSALDDPDGFLRYKTVAALQTLRRNHESLSFSSERIEALALAESRRYFTCLSLCDNLFERGGLPRDSMLAQALSEKMRRATDRMYLLLGLIYPWRDVAAARWTLEHGDGRSRASASEYLDNVLTGQLRKRILPALEDMPREEKVRRGNVFLRTRPRDVDETLLRLINDEDEVISAAAIDLIAEQKRWALADDIEHVLAHRDVRDWFVFEAASWALAERRVSAERRRELWREPLPAAALASRLRALPLFASVSIDELFRIARAGRQERYETGRVLLQEGVVPETVHVLLDGRVLIARQNVAPASETAPAAIGLEEALQGTPAQMTARALEPIVTLALSVDELRTLVADNTALVQGLFATLARAWGRDTWRLVISTGAVGDIAHQDPRTLSPLQKMMVLQRVPMFARVDAAEMAALASIARTLPFEAGARLFEPSTAAALWVVLSGELTLEPEGASPLSAREGHVVGTTALLTGELLGVPGVGTARGAALAIDREQFFDVLEQRPALLQELFVALFKGAATHHGVM